MQLTCTTDDNDTSHTTQISDKNPYNENEDKHQDNEDENAGEGEHRSTFGDTIIVTYRYYLTYSKSGTPCEEKLFLAVW